MRECRTSRLDDAGSVTGWTPVSKTVRCVYLQVSCHAKRGGDSSQRHKKQTDSRSEYYCLSATGRNKMRNSMFFIVTAGFDGSWAIRGIGNQTTQYEKKNVP